MDGSEHAVRSPQGKATDVPLKSLARQPCFSDCLMTRRTDCASFRNEVNVIASQQFRRGSIDRTAIPD
jgi:hypothetical protein